jgi:hypothetical protein
MNNIQDIRYMDSTAVRHGLELARSIVRRRFLDAFDTGGSKVLSLIMCDLAATMDDLDSTDEMSLAVSELMSRQNNEELNFA